LSKPTVTAVALVLRWKVSCMTTCVPSLPVRLKVLVECLTSFWLLLDSPNQETK